MRVIIAGGRNFNDYNFLKSKMDEILSRTQEEIEVVSGTAKGVDTLGERYATENGYQIKRFPADWDQYGKRAGFVRNEQMAKYATHCVCFWDGESRGTKSMIELAKTNKLIFKVVKI